MIFATSGCPTIAKSTNVNLHLMSIECLFKQEHQVGGCYQSRRCVDTLGKAAYIKWRSLNQRLLSINLLSIYELKNFGTGQKFITY